MIMPMSSAPSAGLGHRAEDLVAQAFDADGWQVQRNPVAGPYQADLLVRKKKEVFLVEIKALSEGRPDRVIPLLSQAILQAKASARGYGMARPMAVVYVGDASASLL